MPISRRALLTLLAACALAPGCHAETLQSDPAPEPANDPAPFAVSTAPERYWPVITNSRDALLVSALFTDGADQGRPLRRFNAPRPAARADNPTRRHVGVDLFADPGDQVVAVEARRLIAFYPFLRASTGEMSYALLVAHEGYVANYGEVRATSLADHDLALGDQITPGQPIASISDTSQLHFETYAPGVTRTHSWAHGAARPTGVLNPTVLLLDLAAHGRRLPP